MPIPSGQPQTGPTALLIHGLGSRGSDLANVARALGVSTSTPDLRGHGDAPPRPFTAIADFAADLEPAARAAAPVLVAGFSFGAWVALALWRRAPEAVCGVALVDPPLEHDALIEWARADTRTRRGAIRKLGALYRTGDLGTAIALMGEHPLTRDLDEAAAERNARALLAADPATLQAALRLAIPDPAAARPADDRTPVLVLHGRRSLVCPAAAAADLARSLGGAAAEYDGGHCAHLETPDAVAAALHALLSRACPQAA